MIRAAAARGRRCRAFVHTSQTYCGNRARFRLVWTYRGVRQLSRIDTCGKHHRPAVRQLAAFGITVARKAFAQVRA